MSDLSKPLRTLLKKLEAKHPDAIADAPPPTIHCDPIIHELVYSLLLWEAGAVKARAAIERITQTFVDYNEFRICLPDELAETLGVRYPRVDQRCERIKSALNEIFVRQNGLTLESLSEMPKRDARTFLESLPGVPPFVAARVCLLSLGAHAFPLDERLAARLASEGVIEADEPVDVAAGKLERAVRAGDAVDAYALLESHDEHAPASRAARSSGSKSTKKKRTSSGSRKSSAQ